MKLSSRAAKTIVSVVASRVMLAAGGEMDLQIDFEAKRMEG